ncbi:iron-sulfur cluster assembly accessory protein [Enterobacteriaceae endosymbiont of Donacia cincticornis]|uniref:HesB/IscA family protein n=1 Tax=Enterobacteriaceae endosymbiont of Donacia cincticornis TaxID=2675773 RepID=UPI001448B25A|nr:iron-sulfur cluster assembly accessory protein [Enterobacteriaceae endosymbiont of Donacia cincticornis]QJC36226.1 iron-sulfur cluster assembly accessory protein [Enterobacteriaceae endosymbiont of Donacia cincticornis]
MKKKKDLIHLICAKNNYKGLYITQTASLQINKIIKKNNSKGIKLFLKKSGCFGLKYNILLLDKLLNNEIIFQKNKICISVNNEDLIFIDGTIIDFIKDNFYQSFQFYNNKIKQFCGCKKSFTFK